MVREIIAGVLRTWIFETTGCCDTISCTLKQFGPQGSEVYIFCNGFTFKENAYIGLQQGSHFPATLEIRGNIENEFAIFQSGKTREIYEKHKKNQGKLKEFVMVTQKEKVFDSLGYVRLVPSCVH